MDGEGTLSWRKSSYSGNNGGDCVESASGGGVVLVRDTKQNQTGPALRFSAAAWTDFASGLKRK